VLVPWLMHLMGLEPISPEDTCIPSSSVTPSDPKRTKVSALKKAAVSMDSETPPKECRRLRKQK